MARLARILVLTGCVLVLGPCLFATTYYIDYSSGSDGNNGTSKTSPWQNAPGMHSCTGLCKSTTIKAGDSIILKGCVTWPNAALPWSMPANGNSSSQIYFGVDKTWWDSTVSGCSSAWNRPILNGQGMSTNRGNGREDIIDAYTQYNTIDNIEITGHLGNPALTLSNNATNTISLLGGSGPTGSEGVILSNLYIHGWVNPYFCFGTGNIAANSSTITNFVPSYCNTTYAAFASYPSYAASGYNYLIVQVFPQGSYWSVQSNGPSVQAISGSNPYTITTNSTTVGTACTGCNIIVGEDNIDIIAGNQGGNTGAIVENTVIDGSDTAEVANLNPYGDCGLAEGNNNLCVASGVVGWRGPQIWLNNVIQFAVSGYVGSDGWFGGNTYRYLRQSINPSSHTNIIEAVDASSGLNSLIWNNVFEHTTNPNPNTPGGQVTVGLSIEPAANTGLPSYTFNNVISDTIRNAMFEPLSSVGYGVPYFFNNTADCGPSWSLTYACTASTAQGGYLSNNNFITTGTYAGSGWTESHDVNWTPTQARSAGYTSGETYIYSPPNSNCSGVTPCTVGAGLSMSSVCSAVTAIYAAAGAACLKDTSYGAFYNTCNHTVTVPARPQSLRTPQTGVLSDIGAYQSGSNENGPPPPPGCLSGLVVH